MAIEEAKKYLAEKGYEDRVMELDHSSATVAESKAWIDVCKGWNSEEAE